MYDPLFKSIYENHNLCYNNPIMARLAQYPSEHFTKHSTVMGNIFRYVGIELKLTPSFKS